MSHPLVKLKILAAVITPAALYITLDPERSLVANRLGP